MILVLTYELKLKFVMISFDLLPLYSITLPKQSFSEINLCHFLSQMISKLKVCACLFLIRVLRLEFVSQQWYCVSVWEEHNRSPQNSQNFKENSYILQLGVFYGVILRSHLMNSSCYELQLAKKKYNCLQHRHYWNRVTMSESNPYLRSC